MNEGCKLYLSLKSQVGERGAPSGKKGHQIEDMISALFPTQTVKLNSEDILMSCAPFWLITVA